MKKKLSYIFILLLCSCTSIDILTTEYDSDNSYTGHLLKEGQVILGEQIQIPYSIDNLMLAYNSLPSETRATIDTTLIKPTHYYVKFAPKNQDEVDILRNISPRLMLNDVPLDYEIKIGGTFYHDPCLPDTIPTFSYATIPLELYNDIIDTLSVQSEILIKAYMPDYNIYGTKSSEIPSFYEVLIKEAYKITNNTYEQIIDTKGSSFVPSGRIMAYDDKYNGLIPISKVRVQGTHLLRTVQTLTDDGGYYRLSEFKNPATMKVLWESDDWDIRSGYIGQAFYQGPKIDSGTWNLYADNSDAYSETIRYAAIHRAAHRYYYGNNCWLSRPNNKRKEKIGYFHSQLNGAYGDYSTQIGSSIWTDIRIAGKDLYGLRNPSSIFSTTCHELGHASNYINATSNYTHSTSQLLESWARFAQYILTIQEYKELGKESTLYTYPLSSTTMYAPDNEFNFQYRNSASLYNIYTSLFIDLYDDYDQSEWPGFANDITLYPKDRINGFPPPVIEHIAFSSRNFDDVHDYLFTLYNSGERRYNLSLDNVILLMLPYHIEK